MAEKVTRKQALENAITVLNTIECEQFGINGTETCEVLSKMLESISKPRKAVTSKARVANENLAHKVAENTPTEVTTKDVVNLGIPEIATTQKASAVLRVACELGLFEKVVDGKKVSYKKVIEG